MAYKLRDIMTSRVERVEGIDLGGLSVDFVNKGGRLTVTDPTTKRFHSTPPIVEYEKAGSHIYAKDIDGVVYTNSDIYADRFAMEIKNRDWNQVQQGITPLAQMMTLKCILENKKPVIIPEHVDLKFKNAAGQLYPVSADFIEAVSDIRKNYPHIITDFFSDQSQRDLQTVFYNHHVSSGEWDHMVMNCGLSMNDIANGLPVQFICGQVHDVRQNIDAFNQPISIPHVQGIGYENGLLAIESRTTMFTNIPGVEQMYTAIMQQGFDIQELQQHLQELTAPQTQIEGQNYFHAPGDLDQGNNFFHTPGNLDNIIDGEAIYEPGDGRR